MGGVETSWGLNQEVSMVSQVPARVLWFTCGAFCHPGPGCFATCSMLIQDSSFLATSSEIFLLRKHEPMEFRRNSSLKNYHELHVSHGWPNDYCTMDNLKQHKVNDG